MSRYQPQIRGGGGKSTSKAGGGKALSKSSAHSKPTSKPAQLSQPSPASEPLLHTHGTDNFSSNDGSNGSLLSGEDTGSGDETRVERDGGKKGGMGSDVEMLSGGEDDGDEDDESDEGGWNADEPTLVLPDEMGDVEESSEEEDGREDEERTTNEINEMLQELGSKEYARLRKELQEGIQPLYNSLQTLHSQANKHAKTLGTHKHAEIAALQELFDRLGTQGADAFAFTKDYEAEKAALCARFEEIHARKEARKLKFIEDVEKLRRTNRAKHDELLTEAADAYASFTHKANYIGSDREFQKEVNKAMKKAMPTGR